MSNNNHNNPSCGYADQMIAYLYNEADAREKTNFETHLKKCPACADELAAFGFVRSAVLDWRTEEFSKLPTPTFDVSYAESEKLFSTHVVANENPSRLGGFRQMFSLNSMKAAATFGILVICAGVMWLAFNSSGGNQTAENGADKNTIQTVVSPTVKLVNKQEESIVVPKDIKLSASPDVADSTPVKRVNSISPNKRIVKVSENAEKNNSDNAVRSPKAANDADRKTLPVEKKRIPNLNDAEDDEDETIRLADLFDELDTKE